MSKYRYNEDKSLAELRRYIDSTYGEHYSKNKFQATEFIIDGGHGEGFCIGNIMKYAQRYGKKNGYNRKDILKVIHYAIIQLYVHDTTLVPVKEPTYSDTIQNLDPYYEPESVELELEPDYMEMVHDFELSLEPDYPEQLELELWFNFLDDNLEDITFGPI
jgi:hypothetical protein